jgi:P4 family phage/plasmid primase-like protien
MQLTTTEQTSAVPATSSNLPLLHKDTIYEFFRIFSDDPEEIFTVAFLDDADKCAVPDAGTFHGKVHDCLEKLGNLQSSYIQQGKDPINISMHITLNRTNLLGRKSNNIESCRVLAVDLDGVPQEKLDAALALYPHAVVQSSEPGTGKFHCYWRLDSGFSLWQWKRLQLAFGFYLSGDLNLDQVTKTLRVPGISRYTKTGTPGSAWLPTLHRINNETCPWSAKLSQKELDLPAFSFVETAYAEAEKARKEGRKKLSESLELYSNPGAIKESKQKTNKKSLNKKSFKELATEGRNTFLYYALKRFTGRFVPGKKAPTYVQACALAAEINQAFAAENPAGALGEKELESVINSAFSHGVKAWESKKIKFDKRLGDMEEKQEEAATAEPEVIVEEVAAVETVEVDDDEPDGEEQPVEEPAEEIKVSQAALDKLNGHASSGVNGTAAEAVEAFQYDFSDPWLAGNSFSDLGLTARVLQRFGKSLVRSAGNIWAFNEELLVWRNQDVRTQGGSGGQEIYRMIKCVLYDLREDETFLRCYCCDKEGFSDMLFKKAVAKFESANKIKDIVGLVKKSNNVKEVDRDFFDAKHDLLHVQNGLLNLQNGLLRPVSSEDYQQCMAKVKFEPGAKCEGWERFLMQVYSDDREQVEFMQEVFGYSLQGLIDEQVIFCHCGTGANGKSKLLSALAALMGTYAATLAPDDMSFSDKKFAKPFERVAAKIEGKRLMILDDLEVTDRWSEATVKNLTGKKVRARAEYEQSREINNRAKVHLGLNAVPKPQYENYGLLRRLCMIPYAQRFDPTTESSNAIDDMIERELSGILNWAIEGYRRWKKRGKLVLPQASVEALQEYKDDNFVIENTIGQMFAADIALQEENFHSTAELYEHFRMTLVSKGIRTCPVSLRVFGAELRAVTRAKGDRRRCGGGQQERGFYMLLKYDPEKLKGSVGNNLIEQL